MSGNWDGDDIVQLCLIVFDLLQSIVQKPIDFVIATKFAVDLDQTIIKMNAESEGTINYKGKAYSPAQLSSAFGVTGYPATLFLKDNGDAITLLPGYMDAPMFLHVLSFIAENHYETKQFDQYLKEIGVKQ